MTVADELQGDEEAPAGSTDEAVEADQGDSRLPTSEQAVDKSSLITIDEAKQQISAELLSVLADRFNGKLSEVRCVDEKDMLLNKGNLAADLDKSNVDKS